MEIRPYMGNDPLSLLIRFHTLLEIPPQSIHKKWKLNSNGWDNFHSVLQNIPLPTPALVKEKAYWFRDVLTASNNKVFLLPSDHFGFKPRCPWWLEEYETHIAQKRKAYQIWRRAPTLQNKVNFRHQDAHYCRPIT